MGPQMRTRTHDGSDGKCTCEYVCVRVRVRVRVRTPTGGVQLTRTASARTPSLTRTAQSRTGGAAKGLSTRQNKTACRSLSHGYTVQV